MVVKQSIGWNREHVSVLGIDVELLFGFYFANGRCSPLSFTQSMMDFASYLPAKWQTSSIALIDISSSAILRPLLGIYCVS